MEINAAVKRRKKINFIISCGKRITAKRSLLGGKRKLLFLVHPTNALVKEKKAL